MKEDDEAGRKNRLKFARDSEAIFEILEPEMQKAVDTALSGIERPNGAAAFRAEAIDTEGHVFRGEWPAQPAG
jgi:hypothetical protein